MAALEINLSFNDNLDEVEILVDDLINISASLQGGEVVYDGDFEQIESLEVEEALKSLVEVVFFTDDL